MIEATHFAFEKRGDRYVGGDAAYAVSVSGSEIAVAPGTREITPTIACNSTTSCVAPYRWFNPSDTLTDADRIKARVLTY